jgi:hypothetical protein
MRNLTKKQIEEIKNIKVFYVPKFHGNRKYVGSLPIALYIGVIEKRLKREAIRNTVAMKSGAALLREIIDECKRTEGTSYFKRLISGNTGTYLASPSYGHSDYNKSRVFDLNERTIRYMDLFNKIFNL